MKLREFIEKFCYGDTDIKIRGISRNSISMAYMIFQGYEYDIASETGVFNLIEDLKVLGVKVEKDYLFIIIDDREYFFKRHLKVSFFLLYNKYRRTSNGDFENDLSSIRVKYNKQ